MLKTILGFHPPPLGPKVGGSKFKVVAFLVSCQQLNDPVVLHF